MREFGVISVVLVGERDHKIALGRQGALAKPGSDFGLDPTDDLLVERHIVICEIDILLGQSRLRHQRKPQKCKENSEVHVGYLTENAFQWKVLVCGQWGPGMNRQP